MCMASAHKTGGLMELGELRQRLIRARWVPGHGLGAGPVQGAGEPPPGHHPGRPAEGHQETQGAHRAPCTAQPGHPPTVWPHTTLTQVLGTGFTIIPLDTGRYLVQVMVVGHMEVVGDGG